MKCSASITIAKVSDGSPAPFTRQIWISSKNKPARPDGNGSQVPAGWNLVIPPRESGESIWTSVSPIDVVDGVYKYTTWSEPSAVTPDSVATIIVQWKWGSSDKVAPDAESSVITIGNTILSINGQAVTLPASDDSDWSDTIPEQPAGLDYLWKREWRYANATHEAGWEYFCVSGMQGVEGSYSGIGYVIAGHTITFSGLDKDDKPTLASFRVPINGEAVLFQSASFTLSNAYDRYFLVAHWETQVGSISMCYMKPYSETDSSGSTSYRMKWIDLDDNEIKATSYSKAYVLADIRMDGASIKSVTLCSPTEQKAYENDYFMSILSDKSMTDINTIAKAMDIERVFEKVAALNAFIDKLFANEIHIMPGGYISSKGYSKGDKDVPGKTGFYLESSGYAEMRNIFVKDADVSGSFHCYDGSGNVIMETATGFGSGLDISASAKYWNMKSIYDYLSPSSSAISATYGGSSRYIRRIAPHTISGFTNLSVTATASASGGNTNSNTETKNFKVPVACRLIITASYSSDSGSSGEYYYYSEGSASIKINNTSSSISTGTTSILLNAGDSVVLTATAEANVTGGSGSGSGQFVSTTGGSELSVNLEVTEEKIVIADTGSMLSDNNSSMASEIIENSDRFTSTALTFSGFNSADHIKYTDYQYMDTGTSNLMMYSTYSLNKSSSTLVYDGSTWNVSNIRKSDSFVSLECSKDSQNKTFIFNYSDMGLPVSVSLKFELTNTALTTGHILPADSDASIGLVNKPYKAIYSGSIYGSAYGYVNGNDSSRTNTSAKVWGAVAN